MVCFFFALFRFSFICAVRIWAACLFINSKRQTFFFSTVTIAAVAVGLFIFLIEFNFLAMYSHHTDWAGIASDNADIHFLSISSTERLSECQCVCVCGLAKRRKIFRQAMMIWHDDGCVIVRICCFVRRFICQFKCHEIIVWFYYCLTWCWFQAILLRKICIFHFRIHRMSQALWSEWMSAVQNSE